MKTIKKAIAVLSVAATLNAQAQSCCVTDSYSSSTPWVFNGSTLSVAGGTFNFALTPDGAYNYATRSLNCTLHQTWKADVDFIYTHRGSGTGHTILAAAAGTANAWYTSGSSTVQDAVAMYLQSPTNGAQSTDSIFGNAKKGGTWGTASRGIHIAENTQYYLRLEKLSHQLGQISVFTNAARTTHATGSPKTFTWPLASNPTGLWNVQSGSIPLDPSSDTLTATLDNLHICDSTVTPPPCCDTIPYSNSTGWTFNGSTESISGGTFNFSVTPCGAYNYAVDSLPCYVSDSAWVSNVDFIYTARSSYGPAYTILGVQAGTQDTWNSGPIGSLVSSTQNAVAMYLNCPPSGAQSTDSIFGRAKSGNTWGTPSKGIHIAMGTQYYLSLQRVSSTLGKVFVYTNSSHSAQVAGSPQTFPIAATTTGLHVIEHGCIPQGYSGRTQTGTIDNFNICGNEEGYRLANPTTMGIESTKISDVVNVYPNPNNGSFTIETNGNEKQNTVMLYDVTGKLVLSQIIIGKATIDAGNLNAGIYNLSIISNNGVTNKRIIIQK
jgi:hypothetical protein